MGDVLPEMGEIVRLLGHAVAYGVGGYLSLWGLGHIGWVIIDQFRKES